MIRHHKRKPSRLRLAIRHSILAQAAGNPLEQILYSGGVASLLVLLIGGSEMQIGIIFTAYYLCRLMGLFLIPYLEVRSRKGLIYRWSLISVLCITLIFLIQPVYAALGSMIFFWFLALALFTYNASSQLGGTAWLPYMYDLLPAPIRGRYFGQMRTAFRITTFLGTLLAGWILGKDPGFLNFYVVLLIFISLSAFRLYFVRKLPDISPIRSGKLEPLWQNLSKPLTDRSFRRFLVFVLLIWLLYPATKAFMIAYLKLELGFPTSLVVYASSCFALGSILSLIAWGKIADKLGSRFTFLTAVCLLALSYLIVIFVPSYLSTAVPAFCLAAVAFLIQGAGFSGMGIAYSVRMMYEVREEFSGAYITLCRICLGAAGAVGPLISGAILERLPQRVVIFNFELFSKQPFFLIMSALTLLLLVYLKNLHPIAEQKLGEIIRQLLNSSFGRLNNQLAQIIGAFNNNKTKDKRSLR